MRFRKSSKLKSTAGSWVSGLSEYDMVAFWDCDARKEEVLVENAPRAIDVAIFSRSAVDVAGVERILQLTRDVEL